MEEIELTDIYSFAEEYDVSVEKIQNMIYREDIEPNPKKNGRRLLYEKSTLLSALRRLHLFTKKLLSQSQLVKRIKELGVTWSETHIHRLIASEFPKQHLEFGRKYLYRDKDVIVIARYIYKLYRQELDGDKGKETSDD